MCKGVGFKRETLLFNKQTVNVNDYEMKLQAGFCFEEWWLEYEFRGTLIKISTSIRDYAYTELLQSQSKWMPLKPLYSALPYGINYSNRFLSSLSMYFSQVYLKVQNIAARIILKAPKTDHVTQFSHCLLMYI